jgi:hypothetical protein
MKRHKLSPSDITQATFAEWRSPALGNANPQPMNNPLWEWLIESELDAYSANKAFDGPSSIKAGPMWCFQRFGQSTTRLPDSRSVLIGGEHEDHYDPDFYIYNDIVIAEENERPRILGYPREAFPPTDFHSATLIGERIVVIGNLGYPEDRRADSTQVLVVDCNDWSVSRIDSTGNAPGWIHDHQATLQDDARILITGGKVDRGTGFSLAENIDDWLLHVDGWRWQRLTKRPWPRFEIHREDKTRNNLWDLRQLEWATTVNWHDREEQEQKLRETLGGEPRMDVLPQLYRPPMDHEVLPELEDEYAVYRIRIGGVVIRFVEDSYCIQVTFEGEAQADVVESVRAHICKSLESLERTPVVYAEIPN